MIALFLSVVAAGLVLNWALDDADGQDAAPDGDDGDPPSTPAATEGDDVLTLPSDSLGRFDALAGDDSITVEADTGATLQFETRSLTSTFWETDDGEAPLGVDGGAGDDRLLLSGRGYAVTGGAGDDLIDLGDAQSVMVSANGADTVLGGTGGAIVTLTEAASYVGSDGSDVVVSDSSGAISMAGGNDDLMISGSGPVDMGAGDDWAFGLQGASSILGGAGNDTLIGTRSDSVFLPSATDLLQYYVSTDPDTLDGGAGNDVLSASHGDLVISGAGADRIQVYLAANPDLAGTEITDFDPAQDRLVIAHDFFGRDGANPDRDPVPFTGEVSVTETPEGDTVITGRDGQTLVILRGVTGVTVGADIGDLTGLTDLAGTPTPNADYDVILTRFFNVTS